MRSCGVARVDVLHTLGYEDDACALLDALALPYDVALVDYHTLAVERHLCGMGGRFVGVEHLSGRDSGILRPHPLHMLMGAERVIAASRHVAATVSLLCPVLPLICAAHWARPAPETRHVFVPRLWEDEALRVLLIGPIDAKHGEAVVLAVARTLLQRDLPIRLHLLGRFDPELVEAGGESAVVAHGTVEADRLSEAVGRIAPHVAWLPTQAPESWSYILAEVMELHLPLAAGAIGAIPERCRERPATWLLPWDSPADDWVELLLRLRATNLREAPRKQPTEALPAAQPFYFEEYLRPARSGRRPLPSDRHAV